MTACDSQENMRQYMVKGYYKTAMPHLLGWCDEASVTHSTQLAAYSLFPFQRWHAFRPKDLNAIESLPPALNAIPLLGVIAQRQKIA